MSDARPGTGAGGGRAGGAPQRPSGSSNRPSGASHRTLSLKRRVIAAFTERLPFKATALFFSLVLWLIVSAEEPTSGPVPVQFEPVVDTSVDLVGSLPNVQAYVVGTRGDLRRLGTTPLAVHFNVPEDAPDSVRLRLDTLPLTLPSGVNAQVTRFQPEVVTLHFATETRRTLPVRSALRYQPDSGLTISGSASFEPESVQVVGPRRRVAAAEAVHTIATAIAVRDTQPITVPLDTADLGFRVSPATVRVRVPVTPDTTPPVPPDEPPGAR